MILKYNLIITPIGQLMKVSNALFKAIIKSDFNEKHLSIN